MYGPGSAYIGAKLPHELIDPTSTLCVNAAELCATAVLQQKECSVVTTTVRGVRVSYSDADADGDCSSALQIT